jgi:hypothetical protein
VATNRFSREDLIEALAPTWLAEGIPSASERIGNDTPAVRLANNRLTADDLSQRTRGVPSSTLRRNDIPTQIWAPDLGIITNKRRISQITPMRCHLDKDALPWYTIYRRTLTTGLPRRPRRRSLLPA